MLSMPVRIHLFAYQVGFGDCFLLRFAYEDDSRRHVLIDFGTTGLPADVARAQLVRIARDIEQKCAGRLDAVVATHRHADHISGFATRGTGDGPGNIIRALSPRVVVQPWTEQPELAEDAVAPISPAGMSARRHVMSLRAMNEFAADVVNAFDTVSRGMPKAMADRLRFIGEDNVNNVLAVRNLATMGGHQIYAYCGSDAGLEAALPGVRTRVLGPPTLAQSETIRKMRRSDRVDYWHFQRRRLGSEGNAAPGSMELFPGYPRTPGGKLPMAVRWIADRARAARGEQLLQIVTILDRVMNNTSLILLFQAGRTKLLFPGDAQIENWAFALNQPEIVELLRDVDLYKVGHHGSLNATPKRVWAAFTKRGRAGRSDRIKTVLSTLPGKHGQEASSTEVPRRTLLRALEVESDLHSTHTMAPGELCAEIVLPVSA